MAYVDYPVAYVDYPVAYVDYPVAYVEYPVEKIDKFTRTHLYYQFDAKLGQIVPMLVIRLFNQTPGSEKRDFLYKTPDIPPQRPICYVLFHRIRLKQLVGSDSEVQADPTTPIALNKKVLTSDKGTLIFLSSINVQVEFLNFQLLFNYFPPLFSEFNHFCRGMLFKHKGLIFLTNVFLTNAMGVLPYGNRNRVC